jgi:hypothetical protein
MDSDSTLASSGSLFSRLLNWQRPLWLTALLGLALIACPIIASALDGTLVALWREGTWRVALQAPLIIFYIFLVGPILEQRAGSVVDAYRPLVPLDDHSFHRLVTEASRVNPVGEMIAFVVSVGLGALAQDWAFEEGALWLGLCVSVLGCLMLGLLGVIIYSAVLGTRLTRALHAQPLRVDLFDPRPFRSVGRQSLTIALAFIGGVALSTLLTLGRLDFTAWQNWAIYLVLTLVPVALFFFSMGDAHRVLAAEKDREMERVDRLIQDAGRSLVERLEAGDDVDALAASLNGLAVYETQLRTAGTWPYDTAMLRTLFVSMIAPAGIAVLRVAVDRLWD